MSCVHHAPGHLQLRNGATGRVPLQEEKEQLWFYVVCDANFSLSWGNGGFCYTQTERKARPPARRATVPLRGCEGFLIDFGLGFFQRISDLPMLFIDHQKEAPPLKELKTGQVTV